MITYHKPEQLLFDASILDTDIKQKTKEMKALEILMPLCTIIWGCKIEPTPGENYRIGYKVIRGNSGHTKNSVCFNLEQLKHESQEARSSNSCVSGSLPCGLLNQLFGRHSYYP